MTQSASEADVVRHLAAAYSQMTEEIGKVIVGQSEVVEQLLMALFSRGHCLLVGVPGLAKTLLVSTVSRILHLSFKRIQFTPDLMPADITGTDILQDDPRPAVASSSSSRGRSSPTWSWPTRSTARRPRRRPPCWRPCRSTTSPPARTPTTLPEPFFVLATQNPIEQEGTYPLPEAQLDRFMFNIKVGYPSRDEEIEIMRRTTSTHRPTLAAAPRWRTDHEAAGSGAAGRRGRAHLRLRRRPGALHPAARAGRTQVGARAAGLGGRAAGLPVPDPGRQGPAPSSTAGCTSPPTTSAPSPIPCCDIGW